MNNIWGKIPLNTISFMILLVAIMGIWLGWLLHAEHIHRLRKHKHREREDWE